MPDTRHAPRGTTHVSLPLGMDVTEPSALLGGGRLRRHDWSRWRHALFVAGATLAGLAVLLATRLL